jgi:hypothetical protein
MCDFYMVLEPSYWHLGESEPDTKASTLKYHEHMNTSIMVKNCCTQEMKPKQSTQSRKVEALATNINIKRRELIIKAGFYLHIENRIH